MQSALGNRRFGERAGYLCKSHPLDRCSEKCRVVVRDERPGDCCFDRLVTVAPLSAKLLKNGALRTYKGFPHGMPTTEADTINADLLTFIRG